MNSLEGRDTIEEKGELQWLDDKDWNEPHYYETIRTAVMRIGEEDQLILTTRGSKGLYLYQYNPKQASWVMFTTCPTSLTEEEWNHPQYYKTLRAEVVEVNGKDQLILVIRGKEGIHLHQYNPQRLKWTTPTPFPFWTDQQEWDLPQYYESIRSAVVKIKGKDETLRDQLILVARGKEGIQLHQYDPQQASWKLFRGSYSLCDYPLWSDKAGWNSRKYYETIHAAVMKIQGRDQLILVGRGSEDIQLHQYDPQEVKWTTPVVAPYSFWTDQQKWGLPQYYKTIRAAVVKIKEKNGPLKDQLILVARGKQGIQLHQYDPQRTCWKACYPGDYSVRDNFVWTDKEGWDQSQYYKTIRARVVKINGKDQLILVARGKNGVELLQYNPQEIRWKAPIHCSIWTDTDDGCSRLPQYYETIQFNILQNNLILMVRFKNSIQTYLLNSEGKILRAVSTATSQSLTSHTSRSHQISKSESMRVEVQNVQSLVHIDRPSPGAPGFFVSPVNQHAREMVNQLWEKVRELTTDMNRRLDQAIDQGFSKAECDDLEEKENEKIHRRLQQIKEKMHVIQLGPTTFEQEIKAKIQGYAERRDALILAAKPTDDIRQINDKYTRLIEINCRTLELVNETDAAVFKKLIAQQNQLNPNQPIWARFVNINTQLSVGEIVNDEQNKMPM